MRDLLQKYRNSDGSYNLEMMKRDVGEEKFNTEMSKILFKGIGKKIGRCPNGFRRSKEGHCLKKGEKSPKRGEKSPKRKST